MTDGRKDREWLKNELVRLFQDASSGEEPDHPVCVKYADLLYRLLPSPTAGEERSRDPLAALRDEVYEGRGQTSEP